MINWPFIIILFCLSVPGVLIAMPRLIHFLLPQNSEELRKRFSRFAVVQTLLMVLVMCFAGAVLSLKTGLGAPILETVLQGKASLNVFFSMLFPTFLYTLLGLVVFCFLYYGVVGSILDKKSFEVMAKLRSALGFDGCVLYGGVVEEVIGRWGLLNLTVFFALIFTGHLNNTIMLTALILSGLMFALGQIPAYLAAGCVSSRRLMYSIFLLSLCQSLLFGFLFWQYGIISAILGHMLFHMGWGIYDKG